MRSAKRGTLFLVVVLASLYVPTLAQQPNTPSSPPPDFTEVQKAISALRTGDEPELYLTFEESSFSVRKSVRTTIGKSEGEKLLASAQEGVLPQIRILRGKMVAVYEIDENVSLERALNLEEGTSEGWTQNTLTAVSSYPLQQWQGFLEAAIKNGLKHYASYDSEAGAFGVLLFSSLGPASISYGGGSLALPPEFYETMRFSPRHKAGEGTAGYVVIVHDPHSDVSGRFGLLRGLEALLRANSGVKFSFLDEGAFPERPGVDYTKLSNRRIPDAGLSRQLNKLDPDVRLAAVQRMTAKYLIDVARAYQLLHPEQPISAYTIDDNRYLKETHTVLVTAAQETAAFKTVFEAAQTRISKKKNVAVSQRGSTDEDVLQQIFLTRTLERADTSEMSDEDLPGFYIIVAQYLSQLSQSVLRMTPVSASLRSASQTLAVKAKEYAHEAVTYGRALKRNETMARFIAEASTQPKQYGLPIAFIGSYHTQGITAELQKKQIGYIVIEPQRTTLFSQRSTEEREFNKFLENPGLYFASQKTNKGTAELTPQQVVTYHAPFLRTAGQSLTRELDSVQTTVSKLSPSLDAPRFAHSILNNPSAEGLLGVSGAGGGAEPPNAPPGAFAYFESENNKPRLTIFDGTQDRWKGDSRYQFLREVSLRLPSEEKGETQRATLLAAVSIYWQDVNSGRGYSTFYDPATSRMYLVEGATTDVAALLTPPAKKKGAHAEFSMQLAELEKEVNHDGRSRNNRSAGTGIHD